jgi:hypothetical protein
MLRYSPHYRVPTGLNRWTVAADIWVRAEGGLEGKGGREEGRSHEQAHYLLLSAPRPAGPFYSARRLVPIGEVTEREPTGRGGCLSVDTLPLSAVLSLTEH